MPYSVANLKKYIEDLVFLEKLWSTNKLFARDPSKGIFNKQTIPVDPSNCIPSHQAINRGFFQLIISNFDIIIKRFCALYAALGFSIDPANTLKLAPEQDERTKIATLESLYLAVADNPATVDSFPQPRIVFAVDLDETLWVADSRLIPSRPASPQIQSTFPKSHSFSDMFLASVGDPGSIEGFLINQEFFTQLFNTVAKLDYIQVVFISAGLYDESGLRDFLISHYQLDTTLFLGKFKCILPHQASPKLKSSGSVSFTQDSLSGSGGVKGKGHVLESLEFPKDDFYLILDDMPWQLLSMGKYFPNSIGILSWAHNSCIEHIWRILDLDVTQLPEVTHQIFNHFFRFLTAPELEPTLDTEDAETDLHQESPTSRAATSLSEPPALVSSNPAPLQFSPIPRSVSDSLQELLADENSPELTDAGIPEPFATSSLAGGADQDDLTEELNQISAMPTPPGGFF